MVDKMRKLKNWVKATTLVGAIFIVGTTVISNAEGEGVSSQKEQVQQLMPSERQKLNKSLALSAYEENSFHDDSLFLYSDEKYYVFLREHDSKKIYVKHKVVSASHVTNLRTGERMVLHGDGSSVKHVELTGKFPVESKMLVYIGDSNGNMEYELVDEKVIGIDRDFQENFNLLNSTVGSVATGYYYNNKLIAIKKGW